MGLEQQVWSLSDGKRLREVKAPSEKQIEDLLAANIEILDAGWLVIGRQVKTEGGGFIDILCIDQQGALVVVELKRELTPREVTAQALDYASCVSVFTEAQIAETYMAYSRKLGRPETLDKAYERKFGMKLDADAFRGDAGRNEVKIVVVATRMDGSTERIIEYLSEAFKVSINILFFCVLEYNGSLLLSRAWLREREELAAAPAVGRREWNGEYFFNFGDSESRSWEEARKYGFICGGGGKWYHQVISSIEPGSRVWVRIPGSGYVGVCTVREKAVPAPEAVLSVDGKDVPFLELPLKGHYHRDRTDYDEQEFIVKVDWEVSVPKDEAVHEFGFFGNQNIACRPTAPSWEFTLDRLKSVWGLRRDGGGADASLQG